jgi:ribosomal protein S18 acetylase RimI-like enzyme
MVITARRGADRGLRPADVRRDLGGIADLLAEAFAGELDEAGWRILQEMRFWARLGWLLRVLEWFLPPGEAFAPGYVWVEDGRIVGYTMVRRLRPGSGDWLIANVAVAEGFRGRGIGRALVSACLEYARASGARRAVLQVRADNTPALRLYRSLGFQEIGRIQLWRREAGGHAGQLGAAAWEIPGCRVRPARAAELSPLMAHVAAWENPAMRLFEPLDLLPTALVLGPLRPRGRGLWVLEAEDGRMLGLAAWTRREGRWTLRPFVDASATPLQAQWLVTSALQEAPPGVPLGALTGGEPVLSAAMLAVGFRPARTLIGMGCDLSTASLR